MRSSIIRRISSSSFALTAVVDTAALLDRFEFFSECCSRNLLRFTFHFILLNWYQGTTSAFSPHESKRGKGRENHVPAKSKERRFKFGVISSVSTDMKDSEDGLLFPPQSFLLDVSISERVDSVEGRRSVGNCFVANNSHFENDLCPCIFVTGLSSIG
jgi:hypothetical protein